MHKASGVLVKLGRKGGVEQVLEVLCGKVFCRDGLGVEGLYAECGHEE